MSDEGTEWVDPYAHMLVGKQPPAPQRPEPVTVRLDLPDVAGHCDHFAYHEASDTVTLWHTHNGIPIGTRATGTLAQAREAIRKARTR